ncbi:f-box domain-containing protein [Gigaspora margarita]|uniref:F-box domain-containing protein n=1 Tax=Gigaspora margarita TaxID=4874 RepID=A0A8H4B0B7_GIGMA|nr:f-box domain-containing protein [Gigaspora margarita]
MTKLPTECFLKIFNNFRNDYKNLFSFLLVNRHWCRIIVPILWNEPTIYIRDRRLIKIYLLSLNAEERALITSLKIIVRKYPKPLFEYTSYTRNVGYKLTDGIKDWIYYEKYGANKSKNSILIREVIKDEDELVDTIECSLVAMFLRTSKKLRNLTFSGKINEMIFERLYR